MTRVIQSSQRFKIFESESSPSHQKNTTRVRVMTLTRPALDKNPATGYDHRVTTFTFLPFAGVFPSEMTTLPRVPDRNPRNRGLSFVHSENLLTDYLEIKKIPFYTLSFVLQRTVLVYV
jgi:hypothetical protein